MRFLTVAIVVGSWWLACSAPAPAAGPDSGRPVYHFTPPANFINDPNGLVFVAGEYHLFYQHNPQGDRWGHMSWGHAVSRDLVHWEHLPVALGEDAGIMIFSGSAVFDRGNSSGFGRAGNAPMVAIYTGDGLGKQTQNLAWSLDHGRSWTKYAKNPVVDLHSNAFRDPKVFWHAATNRWIMATVMADLRKVRLWSSSDLKAWQQEGDFGPAGATKGVWECPELFEVPIAGTSDRKTRWVLKVDVNDGAVAGGSGGQYFVGRFDGKAFVPDRPEEGPLWIDHGKDFYACQSWNDAPAGAGPIWLAWMNNWQYANDIPTAPWRGAMTIPRVVTLSETAKGLRLAQTPVHTLMRIRGPHQRIENREIPLGDSRLRGPGLEGTALEIIAEFELGESASVGLKVRQGGEEETVIGIDHKAGTVFVDRTHSGATGFSPHFSGRHAGRMDIDGGGRVRLHVFVDVTSVEVFADGGRLVITDQVFPGAGSRGVSLFATGGSARLLSLDAWELRP
jgi:fructan beta-fructosidase